MFASYKNNFKLLPDRAERLLNWLNINRAEVVLIIDHSALGLTSPFRYVLTGGINMRFEGRDNRELVWCEIRKQIWK